MKQVKPSKTRAPGKTPSTTPRTARRAKDTPVAAAEPMADTRITTASNENEVLLDMIARAAYFRAQHRGFAPGNEWNDWFAAEREVTMALRNRAA